MTQPYPLEVEPSNEVRRMNREERERYDEFWDAADLYDEERAFPTRPSDEELIPRE